MAWTSSSRRGEHTTLLLIIGVISAVLQSDSGIRGLSGSVGFYCLSAVNIAVYILASIVNLSLVLFLDLILLDYTFSCLFDHLSHLIQI